MSEQLSIFDVPECYPPDFDEWKAEYDELVMAHRVLDADYRNLLKIHARATEMIRVKDELIAEMQRQIMRLQGVR